MSRFFSLLLLMLTLSQCTSSRYTCIDLTQKKKKDFRYSRIKEHFSVPSDEQAFGSPDGIMEEYPFLVSMETDPMIPSGQAPDLVLSETGSLAMIAEGKRSERRLTGVESRRIAQLKDRLVEVMPPDLLDQMKQAQDTSITRFDETYQEAKSLAIISFSSSIASILAIALPVLIFPLIITSLVTGGMSIKRYKKSFNKDHRGLAIAGLIIGSAWLAFLLIIIVMLVLLFGF